MTTVNEDFFSTQFIIPSNTRYECAQSEINSRIEARTNINIAHLAAIAAIATIYFSVKGEPLIVRLLIGALMPLVSTYFAAYYRHNDYIIGCLSAYCISLEKISEKALTKTLKEAGFSESMFLPTWFGGDPSKITWQRAALSARKFSDKTILGLCTISPIIVTTGGIIALKNGVLENGLNNLSSTAYLEIFLFLWCGWWSLLNIALIKYIAENRDKFVNEADFDPQTGKLKIPELTEPGWKIFPRSFFKS